MPQSIYYHSQLSTSASKFSSIAQQMHSGALQGCWQNYRPHCGWSASEFGFGTIALASKAETLHKSAIACAFWYRHFETGKQHRFAPVPVQGNPHPVSVSQPQCAGFASHLHNVTSPNSTLAWHVECNQKIAQSFPCSDDLLPT